MFSTELVSFLDGIFRVCLVLFRYIILRGEEIEMFFEFFFEFWFVLCLFKFIYNVIIVYV